MKIAKTPLGVFTLEPKVFEDARGGFIKTLDEPALNEHGIHFEPRESYYSTSHRNVIRGMHFQVPPAAHAKLVYVTAGAIKDVILDIRVGSPTYGQSMSVELSAENHAMVYIPVGYAHGFLSLTDGSCVTYLQTTVYSKEHDCGIHALSFGFDWGIHDPIMSDRDLSFPSLADFQSPFTYQEARA